MVVGYTLQITERVTGSVRTIETDGPHTEVFVTSLHPYYVYEFTVAAETIALGPYSNTDVVRTEEDGKGHIF